MKKTKIRSLSAATVVLAAALLQGCGGGGGSDDAGGNGNGGGGTTAKVPEGLWQGAAVSAEGSTDVFLVVLGDGTYWGIYSQGDVAFGVLQGTGTASGASFASNDGRDYGFGYVVPYAFSLASTFSPKASITGTVTYTPPAGGAATFTATYDRDYEVPLSLAALAGNYAGTIGTLDGVGTIVLSVGGAGGFTGVAESGCLVSGNFTARGSAVVNMTVTLDAATCGESITVTGIAGLGGVAGKTLIFAAVTPDRSAAVYGTATRP